MAEVLRIFSDLPRTATLESHGGVPSHAVNFIQIQHDLSPNAQNWQFRIFPITRIPKSAIINRNDSWTRLRAIRKSPTRLPSHVQDWHIQKVQHCSVRTFPNKGMPMTTLDLTTTPTHNCEWEEKCNQHIFLMFKIDIVFSTDLTYTYRNTQAYLYTNKIHLYRFMRCGETHIKD